MALSRMEPPGRARPSGPTGVGTERDGSELAPRVPGPQGSAGNDAPVCDGEPPGRLVLSGSDGVGTVGATGGDGPSGPSGPQGCRGTRSAIREREPRAVWSEAARLAWARCATVRRTCPRVPWGRKARAGNACTVGRNGSHGPSGPQRPDRRGHGSATGGDWPLGSLWAASRRGTMALSANGSHRAVWSERSS